MKKEDLKIGTKVLVRDWNNLVTGVICGFVTRRFNTDVVPVRINLRFKNGYNIKEQPTEVLTDTELIEPNDQVTIPVIAIKDSANTLKDVYGDDYYQHIHEGGIYAYTFPHDCEIFKEIEANGIYTKLIRITHVSAKFATYTFCDYPQLDERVLYIGSVMSESLIPTNIN